MDGLQAASNTSDTAIMDKRSQVEEEENDPADSLSAVEKLCKAITEKAEAPEDTNDVAQASTNGDHGQNGLTQDDLPALSEGHSDAIQQEEPMDVDTDDTHAASATQGSIGGSDTPGTSTSPTKMRCSKCCYVTKNKVLFDNHTCDNQDEDNDLEEQTLITLSVGEGKKFHCSECDFWAQGHAFEEHLMCHIILRPYQCLYCSECFVNRRDIGRHVVLHHQGMKMNCALRALKRAKGLMKAAQETGTYEFYARVAGKVPLQSDPEKAKLSKSDKAKLKKSIAEASSKNSVSASSATPKESASASSGQGQDQGQKQQEPGPSLNEKGPAVAKDSVKPEESSNIQGKRDDSGSDQGQESCEQQDSGVQRKENDGENNTGEEASENCPKANDTEETASEKKGEGHSECSDVDNAEVLEQKSEDSGVNQPASTQETSESGTPKEATGQHDSCDAGDSAESHGKDIAADNPEEAMEIEEAKPTSQPEETSREEGTDHESSDGTKKNLTLSPQNSMDQNGEESMGLKIVAAFSLQDEVSQDSSSNGSSENTHSGVHGKRHQDAATKDSDGLSADPSSQAEDVSQDGQLAEATADTPVVAGENYSQSGDASMLQPSPALVNTFSPAGSIMTSSFLDPPQNTTASYYTSSQVTPLTRASQKNCFFFLCGFGCNFSCLTSPEFRDHLILDHAGESSFSCYHCGFQTHTEDGLVRHISAHAHTYSKAAPLYICGASACKFGTNLVGDFVTHLSSWHPDLTSFRCHDCDEQFWSVQELLLHFDKNFLHIINCPHCTAKTTERRTLLNHIASVHPGKPKMVSVAKQIICRDRKINSYAKYVELRDQLVSACDSVPSPPPTAASPAVVLAAGVSPRDQSADTPSINTPRNKSLVSILTEPIQPQERELARAAGVVLPDQTIVKSEITDDDEDDGAEDGGNESFDEDEQAKGQGPGGGDIAFLGSKADDRDADNFKCKFCTFIARDRCRLEGHEKCHGLPPSRKSRFKCMYCPQGFNNEHKFSSHVSCHPGLIKFNLFCCKRCEFDSNQRHIIIKHIRNTRDQAHMSYGANEDDMYGTLSKTMETRVLECTQCSYMTRHRKHLVHHIKREHASPLKTGITVDCDIVEKYPNQSLGGNRNKALEMALSHDRSAPLPVGDEGNVRENQARRFKCPICQYLVPRAADLKAHVKRHSEIGEITLVMFRCKYCSAASTAREIIYGHLMEKHLGKQIALVKRIVTIDTKGGDNGYAVTSMEDEEDGTEPVSLGQKTSEGGLGADKMVLLIPDSAGETFQTAMQCPCCSFASYNRKTIIQHVSNHHQEVNIMGRRQDTNEVYPLETSYSAATTASPSARITLGEALKRDILIVPDNQSFDEPVRCPKCEYATMHRRNIVQHLEKNHPDVSVMGRNDYPTFEGKSKEAAEANALGKDGMVIIGSGSLDEKIRCLYENYGDKMKCMICQTERPKKFFIHVHILRHLNILLWKCMYCSHKGLQKYKMMDHIKKVHPGLAVCVRYLPVNVEEKVNEYLRNASMIRARRSGEDPVPELSTPAATLPRPSPPASSYRPPPAPSDSHPKSSDNLSSCTIGSDDLDTKLACLYALGEGNRYRCVVCGQEFQRRFAVHRHIVQAHLKVNLIGCGYCELEGVERHIMMDHIIETHKSAPISMRNLAHDLENRVSEFLAKMTLDAEVDLDLPASDIGMDDDFNFKLPEPPQLPAMLPPLETPSPPHQVTPPPRTPPPSTSKNQLNPKLLLLGRDTLHNHLKCLIDETNYNSMRCLVCSWDFPRKYAAHRHILMKHLKVGIIGCPYCSFEGVERYQVFSHIKEDHKDAELSLRYLSVDMGKVVSEFMANLASGKTSNSSSSLPPWSVRKPVTAIKMEALSDGEEGDSDKPRAGSSGQGLVVAMFSKKSTPTVKEEPMDDEDTYGSQSNEASHSEMDDAGEGDSMDNDSDENSDDREVQSTSLLAASGTKAKSATDVLTSIRVITIKERGFKRHVCEKCKFTSLHRSNIVRHIYRVHEQYREQECPVCNYKTLSRVLIQQHMRNEHPGTPFPQGLAKPLKRKPEQTPEDMEYDSIKRCKAAATSRRREGEVPVFTNNASSSSQLYACAYCSFETQTHTEIVQHTRDNHALGEPMKEDEAGQIEDTGPEDTEFETLSASAVKMNQVDLSSGAEDSLLQCFYCAYKTTTEEDLRVHFSDSHPGLAFKCKKVPAWRFVCRSCNVKTRAHSKMRYHLNRHINYRPYTCTTCGTFFPSPDQCRKHCRANNHNETFTYVKIPRKERRLQELLRECQEIAQALTNTPGDSEPPTTSLCTFPLVLSKRKAKKSFSSSLRGIPGKLRRSYEYDAPYTARLSTPGQEERKDNEAQMVCASCDFTAQNVCDVWLHFIKEHETLEFQWMDMKTGHICTETGIITNAKDVPPDLEEPEGPGYSILSNRMLACHSCEFSTATVQAMKSHLRRHLPKRFLCPYCSLRCSRRDTITQHVRCAHKGRELWTIHLKLPEGFTVDSTDDPAAEHQFETVGDSEAVAPAREVNEERIKCGSCDFKQANVAQVHDHFTQEHNDEEFRWINVDTGYMCTYSGEVLDAKEQTPDIFSDDGFTVESAIGNVPTFMCKLCSFNTAFIQAMKSHMKSHLPHGFMCPYCNLCTNSRDKMVSHQTCTHRERPSWVLHLRMPMDSVNGGGTEKTGPSTRRPTGNVNYSCNFCDYASDNLYQYRLHLANHGVFSLLVADVPDDLPFKCGYCVYVAEDEGDFGAHIASHLERRNYRCSKCEYTAFKRSSVQQHIQSTHNDTEDVEVIDLQAENVSEQGGSVEEPKLVNFEAKVAMVPVTDEDLEKEGLSLYSPPESPKEGVTSVSNSVGVEDDVDIIGLDSPNLKDLDGDDVSDSTEEWGTALEESRESTPTPSGETTSKLPRSLLRATLQGRLAERTGQKGPALTRFASDNGKEGSVHDDGNSAVDTEHNWPTPSEEHEDGAEESVDDVDSMVPKSSPQDSLHVGHTSSDATAGEAVASAAEESSATGSSESQRPLDVGNVFSNLNSWLDE